MAGNSPIEWTGTTWNPVRGCTKISPGCKHCYAERMAKRLQAMGQPFLDSQSPGQSDPRIKSALGLGAVEQASQVGAALVFEGEQAF
jgi:protein gp37